MKRGETSGSDLNLYGTTTKGGTVGGGTAFQVTLDGQFALLHNFDNSKNEGIQPRSLAMGEDGNLYGVTVLGGIKGNGTVFRLSTSGVFTLLHGLGVDDGVGATSIVATAQPRTFYGTTYTGADNSIYGSYFTPGANAAGIVFKLVVPVKDDLSGAGISDVITYSPGELTTVTPSKGAVTNTVTRAVASGYYPVATGDFNGDGISDILWTSANRDLYIWYGGPNGYSSAYVGTYPTGWSAIGVGDMDGDGMDDIVWMNSSTHQIAYWRMNGAVRVGSLTTSYTPGYWPVAIGDFNGDGRADILWTSANRDLWIWSSTSTGFTSRYVTTYPAGWKIAGVSDINGDGVDDLVWMNDNGTSWGYWLMSATSAPTIVPMTVPESLVGYGIVASADYNGDGLADMLWSDGTHFVPMLNSGCSTNSSCAFAPPASAIATLQGQSILNDGVVNPLNTQ